ncbi:MAG: hypothetical protein Q8S29_18765 [Phreatobacter sp.]|nr:hypothetical protein [Phreatobacter sp.]
MRLHWLAAIAALVLTADMVAAQTATAPARSRPAATTTTTPPAATTTTTTPRRARSAAQLRNDQIMRDCGAEWRRDKPRLQAAGKTWRTFLPECRARRVRS